MNETHPIITIDIVRLPTSTLFPSSHTIKQALDRRTAQEALQAILHAILFHRLFGTVKPQTFEVLDITMVRIHEISLTLIWISVFLQPGVADSEMEQLIADRVDVLWKGIENGTNKRGQARLFSIDRLLSNPPPPVDNRNIIWKTTPKIMVPGIHGRRRRPMGTMVSYTSSSNRYPGYLIPCEGWLMLRCASQNLNEVLLQARLNIHTRWQSHRTDREAFEVALRSTLSKALHTMISHTSSERGRTAVPLITNSSGISPFPLKMTVKVGGVEIGGWWLQQWRWCQVYW